MEMYRIIIADDDEIICAGLKNTIPWHTVDVEVAATANDGETALELIRQHKPDIALLDINMPFLSGIQLASILSQEMPETKVIILSAYKEFSYVQNAIHCRVFDYLTKPCHNDEVLSVVSSAIEQIKKEMYAKNNEVNHYLSKVLHGDELEDMERLKARCGIRSENHSFEVAVYEPAVLNKCYGVMHSERELDMAYKLLMKRFVGYAGVHLVRRPSRLAVIHEILPEEERFRWLAAVQDGLKQVNQQTDGEFACAIGGEYPGLSQVQQSYLDASNALEYRNDFPQSHVIRIEEIGKESVEFLSYFQECEASIACAVADGVSDGIRSAIATLFDKLERAKGLSCSTCASLSAEMLIQIYRSTGNMELFEEFLRSNQENLRGILRSNSFSGIRSCVLDAARMLCGHADEIRGCDLRTAISRAMKYMADHYSDPELNLKSVADAAHISTSYLQIILKKHKGTNFSDYLNKIQMEEAMAMLKKGDKKIYEVAFSTGFNSSQYFSRKFKKYYGIEPREVKKS